jgi:hypothetical protein
MEALNKAIGATPLAQGEVSTVQHVNSSPLTST